MEIWQETAIGIILLLIIGPAIGNYATSVVFRLPKGQTPFEKHPYCGNCNTFLKPIDLFPILSYLMLRGKCRYCGFTIRVTYTLVEIGCGIVFMANYLAFGVSEFTLLITAIGVFLITLAALEHHEGKLYSLILTYLLALGALERTLTEDTIYGFFYSGFMLLFAALCAWRVGVLLNYADAKIPPRFVWLALLIGVLLPLKLAAVAVALALVLYTLQRTLTSVKAQSLSVSIAICVAYHVYPYLT